MAAEDWIFEDPFDAWDRYEDNGMNDGWQEPRPNDQPFRFNAIEHTTEKAVLFRTDDGLVWIPKSLIQPDKQDRCLLLPHWFDINYKEEKT